MQLAVRRKYSTTPASCIHIKSLHVRQFFGATYLSLSFRGSRFDACLIPAFNPSLLLSDYLSFVLSFSLFNNTVHFL